MQGQLFDSKIVFVKQLQKNQKSLNNLLLLNKQLYLYISQTFAKEYRKLSII